MYKIAVLGDYDSIYGFAALGLDICPVNSPEEAKKTFVQLAEAKTGIIYVTEALAAVLKHEIDRYKDAIVPDCDPDSWNQRKHGRRNRRGKEVCRAGRRLRYSVWW